MSRTRTRALCHPEYVHVARGLCGTCYARARRTGSLPPKLGRRRVSSIESTCSDCGAAVVAWNAGRKLCDECRKTRRHATMARFRTRQDGKVLTLRYAHGLTPEQKTALILKQGGRCAGCLSVLEDGHVDHDHRCCGPRKSCERCRRGILCGDCNRALGLVRDDPETLCRLASYLRRWVGSQSA